MARPSRHLRSLFAINASPTRWPIALKASIGMGLPLAIATALGHEALGLIANTGAFAVLYGPKQPRRFRFRLLIAVSMGLVLSALIGSLDAPWPWLAVLVTVAMAALGALACAALQIGPPGAFFFTLVTGASTNFAQRGVPPAVIVGCIACGTVVALGVGMIDVLVRPYGPETKAIDAADKAVAKLDDVSIRDNSKDAEELRRKAAVALYSAWTMFHDAGGGARSVAAGKLEQRLIDIQAAYVVHHTRRGVALAGVVNRRSSKAIAAEARAVLENDRYDELREAHLGRPPVSYLLSKALRWPSPELLLAARTAFGTLVAGVVALLLHTAHPYWAIAFCVLMLHQGGTRVSQTLRSIQRFIGTLLGLGLWWLIALLHPHGWGMVIAVCALQFTIQMLVTRNYGVAVIFMTPMALLLVASGSGAANLAQSVSDRVVDTAVCSAAAILAVWLIGRSSTAITLLREQLRADAAMLSAVLRDRASMTEDTTATLARRQFLHYELVSTTGVQTIARGDAPAAAKAWDGVALAMRGLGMMVLGLCWYPVRIGDSDMYRAAEDVTREVARELPTADPERVRTDLDRVHRRLLTVDTTQRA